MAPTIVFSSYYDLTCTTPTGYNNRSYTVSSLDYDHDRTSKIEVKEEPVKKPVKKDKPVLKLVHRKFNNRAIGTNRLSIRTRSNI